MDKLYRPIIDDMANFLDALMSREDPKITKLNKSQKREIILAFLKSAGIVKLIRYKHCSELWKASGKFYEAMERGPRSQKYYLSMAEECCLLKLGSASSFNKWPYFATSLATIFSLEYKLFFKWLMAEIDIIKVGFEYLPLHGLNGKSKTVAIEFALGALMRTHVEQCVRNYTTRIKREEKRRRKKREAKRQRCLAEQNIEIASAIEQVSTKVATNSSEAGPTPERPITFDAFEHDFAFNNDFAVEYDFGFDRKTEPAKLLTQ
jgi:hypothetical protein